MHVLCGFVQIRYSGSEARAGDRHTGNYTDSS